MAKALRPTQITLHNKQYPLPLYSPDATWAVARNMMSADLQNLGLLSVMVNSYHLFQHPGEEVLQKAGGVKNFMQWPGLLSSDSGGFQVFSLIQKNPDLGKITDEGIVLYQGPKKRRKILFTPEISIHQQFTIGSDIMIALDDFTPPNADEARIEQSVKRTLAWATRAKTAFENELAKQQLSIADKAHRPWLLAPIQGHRNSYWRKYCADALLEIGFDMYGLGGWPFDQNGQFDYEYCRFNASLTPDEFPRFALGVGTPENMIRLYAQGYDFFDCVLPTRDARHQRLYCFAQDPKNITAEKLAELWHENRLAELFQYRYINRGSYRDDFAAVDPYCDCPICQKTSGHPPVSRAYLQHLFQIKENAAFRFATLHNLRHFSRVMELLREKGEFLRAAS
jgi:queuine tRNA-ribosyltransferase